MDFRRDRADHETLVVLRQADAAYKPYACPATAECCQLAQRQREPWLWPTEWRILFKHVGGELPPERADGGCPFLDSSGLRCRVYEARPFGCRTFFCDRRTGPKREPVEQVIALSKRLERVAQSVDPDCAGPRPLREWIQEARALIEATRRLD
ncbi:MAG: YkgJ family cysteine cluster protein [Myxococcaceae bacterium]